LLPLGLIRANGSAAVDGLGLPENAAEVLLICHSGMRSRMAQGILSADTRRRYVNVSGGMSAWAAQGLPVSQK
jgi:rhodanese-related sulfurtransferase